MKAPNPALSRFQRWAPLLAVLWIAACLGAMGATVPLLKGAVNNAFFLRSAGISQSAQTGLQEWVGRHSRDLNDLAQNLGAAAENDERDFEGRAVRVLRQGAAFAAVNFINDRFVMIWGFPYAENRSARGLDLKTRHDALAAARRSLELRGPAASGLVDLLQGGLGVLFYTPVYRDDQWVGLVEGAFRMARFATEGATPFLGPGFRFAVVDERRGEELFSTLSEADRFRTPAYDTFFTLAVADRMWWMILHPVSPPPALAIVSGVLLLEAALGAGLFCLAWRRWVR